MATLAAAAACSNGERGDASLAALAPGDPGRGQRAFSGMCAECHGSAAQGIPSMGIDLRGNAFVQRASTAQLIRFIQTGHAPSAGFPGGMPEDGGDPALTGQQLADIVSWLKSLGGSAATGGGSSEPPSRATVRPPTPRE